MYPNQRIRKLISYWVSVHFCSRQMCQHIIQFLLCTFKFIPHTFQLRIYIESSKVNKNISLVWLAFLIIVIIFIL